MDWETFILSMIAGIALFLYGMELLTDSMKLVLGDRFKVMIEHVTKTRFHGFLLGGALTIACQSSTIVTVLIVGLVGVDLMTFEQSIGIILGSNLGSTVTGQIISFNITKYYTAIISLGVFTTMLVSKQRRIITLIGNAIIGLGVILLGMDIMSSAAKILKTEPAFMDFVEAISNRIVAVIVGIVITVILQSSGVVSAILLSLASQGLLSLDIGIAIMIGANLGSCSTALIAGMRQSRVAQQVAFAHTFFNVVLVLLWTPMLPLMMDFVRLLPPHADDSSDDFIKRSTEIPRQIANAHTFMNLFTLIFLFPFTKQMAWIITKIRPAGTPVKSTSTSISVSGPQSQHDQKPILPPLEPQYLNQAYLSLPSVQLGWHVLIKETHRLTMCFTDAFQLITQTLVHAQQHQHQQSIMELYQHHHDHPYVDVKHNSISSITPAAAAGTGTMPSSSSPSARESPSSSSWESVFSHDVNDELSLRASWATQLWSYHGTIRAFHSSLVASFDSLTTKQTSNLLNFSMVLQYLQMAIQVIHEQIITPAKSHIHGKQQQQNDISTKDTTFFQLISLVHQSWTDVAIAIAQLETDNTPTSTAAGSGSPTVTVTPAQRVLHISSEVSHLVRMTITSCGSSSNIASLARALKKIYYCGWHIAKLTMEAQLQLQEGVSNGYVGRSSIPSEKNNTLYNAVLKIISLNNMTHMNRSSGSGLESTHTYTNATISRQPSSSVINIHTDPDPQSLIIASPTAHFTTCSTASHTDSDNTPSNHVYVAQTNDQHSTDGHGWSQPMFHGINIAEP